MASTLKSYSWWMGILTVWLPAIDSVFAEDRSLLGINRSRNNVAAECDIPLSWVPLQQVKWCVDIGTQTNASPVVGGGKVFIGTNNGGAYQPRYPKAVDLGVLLCLDQQTGALLWQFSSAKLPSGKIHDWPEIGICSSPLVEGERMWFVSNRGEIVCLDVEGSRTKRTFEHPEHKGSTTTASGIRDAEVLWRFDMMGQLNVQQHNMANCSVNVAGEVLLICTSNGVDRSHNQVAAPLAPSFLGLDKTTGKLIWSDSSPGENILHGQWSSPAVGKFGDQTQAIFAGGDGWLYSFDPAGNGRGGARLLWKFDGNPKHSEWAEDAKLHRDNLIAMPVIHGGKVYIATGQSPDRGEGTGRVWCIDATKKLDGSDVSDELALAADGQPLSPRRTQAIDRSLGDRVQINPQSAAVWCYTGGDVNGDGEIGYCERMHRAIGSVAIHHDIAVAVDTSGVVHCLDAKSGLPYWTHDTMSEVWATPLIVGDRFIVTDLDGAVSMFGLVKDPEQALRRVDGGFVPLARWELGDAIHSTPTLSQGVLFVATQTKLWALQLAGK